MRLQKKILKISGIACWLWASAGVSAAQDAVVPKGLDFPLTQYKLRNGLQVVLSEDNSLPLISVVVAYGVGPAHEEAGKSGLAYLMENLMFQGSENVSPMQHINYIQRIGGEFNAHTTFDKTFFYETLPSNQLALALWLESDRMASLTITAANVERAKTTLLEEHRQRKAAEPYMESLFRFDQLLFPGFVYGHPLIGTEQDINAITEADVRSFAETYYVPNNAVLSISGRLNIVRAKELIAKYFDSIPRENSVPEMPTPPSPTEPPETEMRLEDSLVPSPAVHYGTSFGRLQGNDYYALKILDIVLLHGKSSRLYRRIIKKDKLALYLNGGVDERGKWAAFKIFAISNNPIMAGICRKAISSEINKLKTNLISETELAKAKNLFKADFLHRLSTSLQKSLYLSEACLSGTKLEDIPREFERNLRVTPLMIAGLVNRFFTQDNVVILNVETK